jgi:hypothetical protein
MVLIFNFKIKAFSDRPSLDTYRISHIHGRSGFDAFPAMQNRPYFEVL